MENTSYYNLDSRDMLREATVKIGLERIDIQEEVTVEALFDSSIIKLVISSKFFQNQRFKLKTKYIRNIHSVRIVRSELSSFLIFFLFSIFFLKLFFFSLFLIPRVRVSDNMGHIAQRRF